MTGHDFANDFSFGNRALTGQGKKTDGRGGIRTHGPVVRDARFRVECLKPDSATLPKGGRKRPMAKVQHPTSNAKFILGWQVARSDSLFASVM
jgi:hypothetical protein